MNAQYQPMLDVLQNATLISIEPLKGRDGLFGLVICTGERVFYAPYDGGDEFFKILFTLPAHIVVWDQRRVLDLVQPNKMVWDLKYLFPGDKNLPALAREHAGSQDNLYSRYLELDKKMVAHGRAAKTAKMDGGALQVAPIDLIKDWAKTRAHVILQLKWSSMWQAAPTYSEDYEMRWKFIRALHETEVNGIHVNVPYIEDVLSCDVDVASRQALRSMQGLQKDGFVTSTHSPVGAKTGRLRHEGGFNSLGIPRGPARQAINSRWEGGKIVTFDFNAIDYRCIVKSVGGEVAKLYEGARDFHERTASFIFKTVTPNIRQSIKYLSYIYIYGGSEDTLAQKTGWTSQEVKSVLALLDKKILPIKEFRAELWMQAQSNGFIDIHSGRRVYCQDADNEGKVIGLYAQSYSSWIFERAFERAHEFLRNRKSCITFSVHDELVIDCHPDEVALMDELVPLLEQDGYVVKKKVGENYGAV